MNKFFIHRERSIGLVYFIIVILALLSGCEIFTPNDGGCPLPVETSYGYRIPPNAYQDQKLSKDAKYLSFTSNEGQLHIIDLSSGYERTPNLLQILPDHPSVPGCGRNIWCPYSSNKLLIYCYGLYDTTNSGEPLTTLYNIYIYNIEKNTAERITPYIDGDFGSNHGIGVAAWLKGSTENVDSILTGYGIYIPQQKKMIQSSWTTNWPVQTINDNIFYYHYSNSGTAFNSYINGAYFSKSSEVEELEKASWSPNGLKLSLSLRSKKSSSSSDFAEVWIIDVNDFLKNGDNVHINRINLQKNFCKYSFWGAYAEFITDSTLILSMHTDGADTSNLWEITSGGSLVKKFY